MKHFSCASEANTADEPKKAFAPSSARLYKRGKDVVHQTGVWVKMLQLALLNRVLFGKFNRASALPVVRLRRTGLASELQHNGISSLHFESAEGGLHRLDLSDTT
jgi:hypothetical protein